MRQVEADGRKPEAERLKAEKWKNLLSVQGQRKWNLVRMPRRRQSSAGEIAMQIPILIERLPSGGFRARAGEPFALSAEGATSDAAAKELERRIAGQLASGVQLGALTLPNGSSATPFPADDRYKTDPSYQEMQEILAEFRRAEDEEPESPHP